MDIAIYTRDESGLVGFKGTEDWNGVRQALEYYCRDDETPETVKMMGWPHDSVTWYGDLGIGVERKAGISDVQIKSRKLGRTITFSRPGSSYIYADLNGQPGTMGKQICRGGGTMGSTLSYDGDDQEQFEAICRRWYRAHIRMD